MIYFMQATDGGPVKIGFTDNLDARHKQLESHYRRPLAILATMEGDMTTEREIHARFDHLRLDGRGKRGGRLEQFQPAPDLMEFIGRPLFVNQGDVELMPGPGIEPDLKSIKFDKTLAGMARAIAIGRGVSMAAYLSEITQPIITKDYAKMLRDLEAGGSR